MKKVIGVFLALSILLACSAFAEDFSVRNGITFGMSPTEVMAIEADNGVQPFMAIEPDSIFGGYCGDSGIEFVPSTLAGINPFDYRSGKDRRPQIDYCFTDDSLFRIVYRWHSFCATRFDEVTAAQFETLNTSMAEKYSLLSENRDGKTDYIDFGHSVISFMQDYHNFYFFGYNLKAFNQYLAKCDGGYADIWLYHFTTEPIALNPEFINDDIIIEYTYCTDGQIQGALDSAQRIEDERNNDL